jgi:hypothetical protein
VISSFSHLIAAESRLEVVHLHKFAGALIKSTLVLRDAFLITRRMKTQRSSSANRL